jgi:glycosyltransferase involved in cell wall biosynthesis
MPVCILIPALNPDERLLGVVAELQTFDPACRVVIVNDGSNPACAPVFEALGKTRGVEVLAHERNLGKGAALKTGLRHLLQTEPDKNGSTIVTADADGQHLPIDILAVAAAAQREPSVLVLGARQFSADVPLRSRFGNDLTRFLFGEITGHPLPDTQTGLRAIPRSLIGRIIESSLNGYEFELEMLLLAAQSHTPIRSAPIQTVYLSDNCASHFRPIRDSARVYRVLLRHALINAIPGSVA